ncbi:hypothetical protein [Nitrosospira sp. Nsp13]|uniref:hypothetical protein n=1 Tax=Nitrosospira sp. Nsp13 TaxID=1855332 RepID=UPI0011130AC9|nr:hypothetical protein [Nitrosospira sp. Nsp13]
MGPYEVKIDSHTLEIIDKGHQYRPTIQNHNGSSVPALTFLDPAFHQISAIWAADMDGTYVIGNSHVLAVVHNPNAANPIPPGLLPAHWEYFASRKGNIYEIGRQTGRLYRDK